MNFTNCKQQLILVLYSLSDIGISNNLIGLLSWNNNYCALFTLQGVNNGWIKQNKMGM